jgi:hypothetical protein
MALTKLGPLITTASGSFAGVTISRRSSTYTLSARRSRGTRATPPNISAQSQLSTIRKVWNSLDSWIQQQWREYARSHKFADRLGNQTIRPAHEWFARYYKYSLLTVAGHPNPHYEPPWEDRPSFAAGTVTLTFDTTPAYVLEPSEGLMPFGYAHLEIWASRMLRPAQVHSKHWRFTGFKRFVNAAEDATSLFTNLDWVLLEGEHIATKCRWATWSHWPGPWSYSTTTVTAP